MSTKRFVVAMMLTMGTTATGYSLRAEADCVAWLPYAATLRFAAADAGAPWGIRSSSLHKYIKVDSAQFEQ